MLKILIAEDDRELRQLFSHVLNRHGYTVVGVSNGQEAMDALDKDFYDMIISDIMMPVMDGYELVQQLMDEIWGYDSESDTRMVAVHTGQEITVEFDRPTPLQIDGETILNVTSYEARAACCRINEVT